MEKMKLNDANCKPWTSSFMINFVGSVTENTSFLLLPILNCPKGIALQILTTAVLSNILHTASG